MRRTLAAVLSLILLTGWGPPSERERAARFINGELADRGGQVWDREGALFFWEFDVAGDRCEFTVQRIDREGGNRVRWRVPLSGSRMSVAHDGLTFACRDGQRCITQVQLMGLDHRKSQRASVRVPWVSPRPLAPSANAFAELIRLCSDPYG